MESYNRVGQKISNSVLEFTMTVKKNDSKSIENFVALILLL